MCNKLSDMHFCISVGLHSSNAGVRNRWGSVKPCASLFSPEECHGDQAYDLMTQTASGGVDGSKQLVTSSLSDGDISVGDILLKRGTDKVVRAVGIVFAVDTATNTITLVDSPPVSVTVAQGDELLRVSGTGETVSASATTSDDHFSISANPSKFKVGDVVRVMLSPPLEDGLVWSRNIGTIKSISGTTITLTEKLDVAVSQNDRLLVAGLVPRTPTAICPGWGGTTLAAEFSPVPAVGDRFRVELRTCSRTDAARARNPSCSASSVCSAGRGCEYTAALHAAPAVCAAGEYCTSGAGASEGCAALPGICQALPVCATGEGRFPTKFTDCVCLGGRNCKAGVRTTLESSAHLSCAPKRATRRVWWEDRRSRTATAASSRCASRRWACRCFDVLEEISSLALLQALLHLRREASPGQP